MNLSSNRSRRCLNKFRLFRDLGYVPHVGQVPIHRSTAPRRVVVCGVRWGKTLAAAMEGLAASLEPAENSLGWIVAPTYDLSRRVFREIERAVIKHLRHRVVNIRDREGQILLRNMGGGISEIQIRSADNPVSLLGVGLDWLIVDEAARIRSEVWYEYLSPRLLDRKGWSLVISTPYGRGWLYDAFLRGQRRDPSFASWSFPSWNNPHLDRQEIENERGRVSDRVFRREFGGEFVESSGAVFRNVRACAIGELESRGLSDGRLYYGGLDLAKTEDFTVLAIGQERAHATEPKSRIHVVHLDRFHRLDWNVQVARVKGVADRFDHAQLLVDSTGKGEPVFEALRHAGCSVKPFTFTQANKADLIANAVILLEQGRVVLPRPELCPYVVEELENFESTQSETGTERMGAPSGQHDDAVIAVLLCLWQLRPYRRRGGIFIVDTPF